LSAIVIGHDKHNKLVQLIGRETTQATNHVSLIRTNRKENSIAIFLSLQQYKSISGHHVRVCFDPWMEHGYSWIQSIWLDG
jgi:hypothetical protein